MARYKRRYSSDRKADYIIPMLALLFVSILFVLVISSRQSSLEFLFVAAFSGLVIYWVKEIKRMSGAEEPKRISKEAGKRDWVYDLIKNKDETIFVAEVPGPEDQIDVKMSGGTLYIKGSQDFKKDIPLELADSEYVQIRDYRYHNGVLTVRIQKV